MESPEVVDENEISYSVGVSLQASRNFSTDKSRKAFIQHRRRGSGVLTELEPISESNSVEESYIPRGNLSLIEFGKNRRKYDNASRSFTYNPSSNLSMSILHDSTVLPTLSEAGDSPQTTPPGILRNKIKEAKELQSYLEKELDELRDFTTAERQILSVEKGFDTLQEEHSQLKLELDVVQDRNSNLKMELDQMNKLNNSQGDLITDLKGNLERAKNELAGVKSEKEELRKELENVKRKLIDEEMKNEISESKWTTREEELKRSVEEAWHSLQVKEERLSKLTDKIRLLHSEWQLLGTNDDPSLPLEKFQALDTNILDLFNQSATHIECTSPSYPSSGDGIVPENDDINTQLKADLIKLKEDLEHRNNELQNLSEKLKEKEMDLQYFNDRLHSCSFVFHKSSLSIDPQSDGSEYHCSSHHESIFDQISCEFLQFQQKVENQLLTEKIVVEEVEDHTKKQELVSLGSKSDSGVNLHGETDDFYSFKSVACCSDLKDDGSTVVEPSAPEMSKIIDSYKERIIILESELQYFKNNVSFKEASASEELAECTEACEGNQTSVNDAQDDASPIPTKISSLNKSTQLSTKLEEVSCQTSVDISLIKDYENKIYELENIIANRLQFENKCVQTTNNTEDCSCQTSITLLPPDECQCSINDSCHNISILTTNLCGNVTQLVETSDKSDLLKGEANNSEIELELSNNCLLSSKTLQDSHLPQTNSSVELSSASDSLLIVDSVSIASGNSLFVQESGLLRSTTVNPTVQDLNLTLSDSIGEQTAKSSVIYQGSNDLFPTYEFIELPPPDMSTYDYSFSGNLEQSVLMSKLGQYNTSVITESYDPLSSQTDENSKPLVETPLFHSLNVIEESKNLKVKCKSFSEKLAAEIEINKKSLKLLAEICHLISPKEWNSQSDVLAKSEETLNSLKEALRASHCSFSKEGILVFLHNLQPLLNNMNLISCNFQILKRNFASLSTWVRSLLGFKTTLQKISDLITDWEQKAEAIRINNEKFEGDSCTILVCKNEELKEDLVKLETYHSNLLSTSVLQDELLKKNSELQNIMEDKDNIVTEISEFKNTLLLFLNSVKELGLVKNLFVINEEKLGAKESEKFLQEIVKVLKDMTNSYNVLESLNIVPHNLTTGIEVLHAEKCVLEKSNNVLKHNISLLSQNIFVLRKALHILKTYFSSEMLVIKDFLCQELTKLNILVDDVFEGKIRILKEAVEENIKLKVKIEELTSIESKYSDLLKFCQRLEDELKEKDSTYNVCFKDHESLKLRFDLIDNENGELKSKLFQFERNTLEQTSKMNILEEQIEELVPIREKYAELLKTCNTMETELLYLKEENSRHIKLQTELHSKIEFYDTEKLKLDEVTREYEATIQEYQDKIDILQKDNNCLKSKIQELVSVSSIQFDKECSQHKNIQIDLEKANETLFLTNQQLSIDNNNLKDKVLKYEEIELASRDKLSLLANLQSEFERLKIKLDDCNSECNNHLEQVSSLKVENLALKSENLQISSEYDAVKQSYNSVKVDQFKYLFLIEKLQLFTKFIKSSGENFDETVWDNMKSDCQEVFLSLKEIFSELLGMRNKLSEAKECIAALSEEKNGLTKKLSEVISESKNSNELRKAMGDEVNNLIKREQQNYEQLKSIIVKYDNEIAEILEMLDYREDTTEITEHCWHFIKETITNYKDKVAIDSQDYISSEEKKKIASLELELEDVYNFKKKFSKELHELNPNLRVSDLMKLSLDDLSMSMLKAIMEKEHIIITELETKYESELASNSDRIRQLEEDSKRKIDWIQEIENENDRLQVECKKVQNDNENLKLDVKSKAETIVILETKIEMNKVASNNSFPYDSFEEKSALEAQEKEKSFTEYNLQEKLHSLSIQLEDKDKQCHEALNSLQKKSEKIFNLEKIVSDINVEKSHLEEEVKRLKEDLNAQGLACTEMKMELGEEIEQHKASFTAAGTKTEERNFGEMYILISIVKSLETLIKNMKTSDFFSKYASLDKHLDKIDKLNTRIKQLSVFLNKQNIEIINLRNKEKSFTELSSGLNSLKEINTVLKNENHSLKSRVEELSSNAYSSREVDSLKSELEILNAEQESVVQTLSNDKLAMEKEIYSLNENLRLNQAELELCKRSNEGLLEFKDECDRLKKEITAINEQMLLYREEIKQLQKEKCGLTEQSLDLCHQKDEYSKLASLFKDSQEEVKHLKESNEKLLKELDNCRLKGELLVPIKNFENVKEKSIDNVDREWSLMSSVKLELIEKENDLLNLQRDKDLLIEELNKIKQAENYNVISLEAEVKEITAKNEELKTKLISIQKIIDNKDVIIQNLEAELGTINSKYHSEDNCPYKKDSLDNKELADKYKGLLHHEQETFKLWKINLEEDIECKVLLIGDLETKLKKEIKNYKEAMISNSELHEKCLEAENKIKALEEKINIQREVFIKEKTKLEQEVKYKEQYESKISELQHKSEQIVKSIDIFLDNVSKVFDKTIPDLGSAFHEFNQVKAALDEEREYSKQLDEESEILNKNIQQLENELMKYYVNEAALNEKLRQESEKLRNELAQNENLLSELKKNENCILSLKTNIEALKSQHENEKKAYEININNLLEDKQKLLALNTQMEKKLDSLLAANEHLQKKEDQKIDELMKEINFLKVKIVSKDTKISNLEMQVTSDSLPFLKRAEAAERKVEELSKELKSLRISLNPRDSIASRSSPLQHRVDPQTNKRMDELVQTISRLEEEVKKLQKDKSCLKKIAVLRHKELKELRERLGIRSSHDSNLQDSNPG